ncbi:MAG: type II secretion system F family protein [Candidatus Altiarchaeota archaeon]
MAKKEKMPLLRKGPLREISKFFIPFGDSMLKVSPYISIQLRQSGLSEEYEISAREYIAFCFLLGCIIAIILTIGLTLILYIGGSSMLILGPLIGLGVGFLVYFELLSYPKVLIDRRVRDLERNLLFALRNILIQIRSGVPIFNAMVSVSKGNYGQISDEFRYVVEKVESGASVIDTLEEIAVRNPSIYFRRALWQLVNALKSGSDVAENLSNVIQSLSREQIVQIRRYQSILNPLAMMYMMIAVIAPSLGITVMIILSSFPGMEAISNEQTFWILLAAVLFMQFMFMSIIKTRRPNLM